MIDDLAMLANLTRGNLNEDDATHLESIVTELRAHLERIENETPGD